MLSARIPVARYIASNASSMIADLFHKQLTINEKDANDYVTELDKSIESMAMKAVNEQFPDDGFSGEENLGIGQKNDIEWIVDPIDGTNNFVRGFPLCGFQLAIMHRGSPIYADIQRPLTQEEFNATKGSGAHYVNRLTGERKKITVAERTLERSMGIFDSKIGKKDNPSSACFQSLVNEIDSVRVFGVAVFDLPSVADGSADFLISGIAKKYDIAPGTLLIEEAGGIVREISIDSTEGDYRLMIFCSAVLVDELERVLASR